MSYRREDVTVHGDGVFSVKSQTADYHKMCFGSHTTMPSCTCEDWQRNLLPCKHFCAVFSMVQVWGWEQLGGIYRDNPVYLCLSSLTSPRVSSPPPQDSNTPPRDGTSTSNPPKGNSKTNKRQKCGSLLRDISDLTICRMSHFWTP
ncbi:Immunoglobulin A1 protease [Labeo rohita]|uniref:Immunoglobulin A1 protease n=1 Tax=Labeo rohita TaxID=84645 RepID=A0ABQ8LBR3_LABRO|nr:Immunoglobulin A1 protease [Labeo rohita]